MNERQQNLVVILLNFVCISIAIFAVVAVLTGW